MNVEMEVERLRDRAERMATDAEQSAALIRRAMVKTEALLAIASSMQVNAVAIGKIHPLVGNESWGRPGSFGCQSAIFTHPDDRGPDGWPAAWSIAARAGVSHGAGNPGQHQADTSELIDGVYECRSGIWRRVDLDEVSA